MVGATSAQTFCAADSECVGADGGFYDDGGCCVKYLIKAVAAEPQWGKFLFMFKEEERVPGAFFGLCQPGVYVDAFNAENGVNGESNNYEDLKMVFETNPGFSKAVGFDTPEEFIEGWESTIETHEGLIFQVGCYATMSAIKVAASAAVAAASIATLLWILISRNFIKTFESKQL